MIASVASWIELTTIEIKRRWLSFGSLIFDGILAMDTLTEIAFSVVKQLCSGYHSVAIFSAIFFGASRNRTPNQLLLVRDYLDCRKVNSTYIFRTNICHFYV